MICVNCGTELGEGVKFCPQCGTRAGEQQAEPIQTVELAPETAQPITETAQADSQPLAEQQPEALPEPDQSAAKSARPTPKAPIISAVVGVAFVFISIYFFSDYEETNGIFCLLLGVDAFIAAIMLWITKKLRVPVIIASVGVVFVFMSIYYFFYFSDQEANGIFWLLLGWMLLLWRLCCG